MDGDDAGGDAGYDAGAYGDAFADIYDEWYGQVSDVEATVASIVALAGGGPVLELGVGTGRLAIPLADAGLEVWGVDGSAAMLARLRAKPGAGRIVTVHGDMAQPDLPHAPPFAVVVLAYNTIWNLPSPSAQARCFAAAARALAPGGRLVVETVVLEAGGAPGGAVELARAGPAGVVLRVSRRDADIVRGQHIELREAGVRIRPWLLCCTGVAELDHMAAAAGLALEQRWDGWEARPAASDAAAHVSVYVRR